MKPSSYSFVLAGFLLAHGDAPSASTPPPAQHQVVQAPAVRGLPAVIDVEKTKLSKEEFDRLPDSQVLEFQGTRFTVGEARNRHRLILAGKAGVKAALAGATANFETYRQKFLADQSARVAAANAQVLAGPPEPRHAPRPLRTGSAPTLTDCQEPGGLPWPGLTIVCHGSGFGSASGMVVIKGLNGRDVELVTDKTRWTDGSVYATVPPVSGARRQPVSIQVTVRGGVSSNAIPATFLPTLDVKGMSDMVRVVGGPNCGGHQNYNGCGCGLLYDTVPADFTIDRWEGWSPGNCGGAHGNSAGAGFVKGDKGTDSFTGKLRNDWVFTKVDFRPDPGWPKQTWVSSFAPGSTLSLSVGWTYDYGFNSAGILYNFMLYGEGPLGVPYQ